MARSLATNCAACASACVAPLPSMEESPPPRSHAPTSAISWFNSAPVARTLAAPGAAMAPRRHAGGSAARVCAGGAGPSNAADVAKERARNAALSGTAHAPALRPRGVASGALPAMTAYLGGGLRAVARRSATSAEPRLLGSASRALSTGGSGGGPPSGSSVEELQRKRAFLERAGGGSAQARCATEAERRAALIAYLLTVRLPAKRDARAEAPRTRALPNSAVLLSPEDLAGVVDVMEKLAAGPCRDVAEALSRLSPEEIRRRFERGRERLFLTPPIFIGTPTAAQLRGLAQRSASTKAQRAADARDEHLTLLLKFTALRKWQEAVPKAAGGGRQRKRSAAGRNPLRPPSAAMSTPAEKTKAANEDALRHMHRVRARLRSVAASGSLRGSGAAPRADEGERRHAFFQPAWPCGGGAGRAAPGGPLHQPRGARRGARSAHRPAAEALRRGRDAMTRTRARPPMARARSDARANAADTQASVRCMKRAMKAFQARDDDVSRDSLRGIASGAQSSGCSRTRGAGGEPRFSVRAAAVLVSAAAPTSRGSRGYKHLARRRHQQLRRALRLRGSSQSACDSKRLPLRRKG